MFNHPSLRDAETALDQVPPALEHFDILGLLGPRGAGGSVYRAYDKKLEREVAIKVPKNLMLGDDFKEAIRQAKVQHINVPQIYEIGTTQDNRLYLLMELADGLDILAHCELNRLPLKRRIRLLVQICNVVHFFHTNDPNVHSVHRDLRIPNIKVTKKGDIVKVMDFGLSSQLDQHCDDSLDADAQRSTIDQSRWYGSDVHLDLYSIGIIAWQLLVGEPLSTNAHRIDLQQPDEVARRKLSLLKLIDDGGISEEFARSLGETPRTLQRKLKGDLKYILEKMIGCDTSSYSAMAMEVDLQCYLDRYPLKSRRASLRVACVRFAQRYPTLTASTSLLSIALLLVGTFLFFTREELGRSEQREFGLNGQLADIYEGVNPARPSESIARTPQSILDMLLSSVNSVENPDTSVSDEAIRKAAQLADSLSAVGFHQEAEETWRVVYEDYVNQQGEDSLETMLVRSLFSAAKLKNGKGEEALQLALANTKELLKLNLDTDNAIFLFNAHVIAGTQAFGGHHDIAIQTEEEVLRRNGGKRHDLWADANHTLATSLMAVGELNRALEILNETREYFRTARGEYNPMVLKASMNRAIVLQKLGKHAEGISEMRAIVDVTNEIYLDGGPAVTESMLVLAAMLRAAGEYAGATAIFKDVAGQTKVTAFRLRALVELQAIEIITERNISDARQELIRLIPIIEKEHRIDSPILHFAKQHIRMADEKLGDRDHDDR